MRTDGGIRTGKRNLGVDVPCTQGTHGWIPDLTAVQPSTGAAGQAQGKYLFLHYMLRTPYSVLRTPYSLPFPIFDFGGPSCGTEVTSLAGQWSVCLPQADGRDSLPLRMLLWPRCLIG